MVSVTPASTSLRARAERYSPTQRRTIATALDLFAEHGVGGTSIQMIADRLGVTKAAVYHQFKAKEAIVVAVLEVHLAQLEQTIDDIEPSGASLRAREAILAELIDGAVTRRRAVSALQSDPVFVRFLQRDTASRQLWARLFSLLVGEDLDDGHRVQAAVLSAAIGSVGHPFVAGLDDDTLRAELLRVARPLLRLPG